MRKNTTKVFEKAGCVQTIDGGSSSNVYKSVFTVNNEIAQKLGKSKSTVAKEYTST